MANCALSSVLIDERRERSCGGKGLGGSVMLCSENGRSESGGGEVLLGFGVAWRSNGEPGRVFSL